MNNTIIVNINEYITNDELREIAKEEFATACRQHFENEEAFKRILANTAYEIVYDIVDKRFNSNLEEQLTNKVVEIIKSLNEYSVFKKPDAWSRETNSAYDILKQAIIANKGVIEEVVRENISRNVVDDLKENIKCHISEAVLEHFNVK